MALPLVLGAQMEGSHPTPFLTWASFPAQSEVLWAGGHIYSIL